MLPVKYGHNGEAGISTTGSLVVTLDSELPAGTLVVCVVSVGRTNENTIAPTSITGGGVTWISHLASQWDTGGTGRGGLYVYRGVTNSPSGTTVSVVPSHDAHYIQTAVFAVPGARTGNSGADAFLQSVLGVSAGSVPSVSLNTMNHPANAFFSIVVSSGTALASWTPDTSPVMSELLDFQINGTSRNGTLFVQTGTAIADVNPTLTANVVGGVDSSIMLGIEFAAARPRFHTTNGTKPFSITNSPATGKRIVITN